MLKRRVSESSTTEGLPIAPSMGETIAGERIHPKKDNIVNKRVFYISMLAIGIGLVTGLVAEGLVGLIGLITNIAFYGRISTAFSSPADNHLGWWVVLVPAVGGVIVGLMARYGSKAIRGHGIPEAMEQVLENGSRIPPAITFLKPISSAIAIGTGGPFGAEGPIIATGGAFGSVIGQILKTTADERKILLTAGAASGMAAIFGSPIAAVLLAIELLLFEFSPRSIIPVALASAMGAAMHMALMGTGAVFAMPNLAAPSSMAIACYVFIGLIIGVLSVGATKIVYLIEDWFEKIPVHWMWWPALGGLAVGFIGYFYPHTMGVGYDNIRNILAGSFSMQLLVSLCVFKFISWSIALGSGTSGGTLAPLFTIGGGAGALAGAGILLLFPQIGLDVRMAALVGMAAIFSGASRALLTSIVFAFEATMQPNALLPLLGGCTAAYFVSFFLMENTIMTEKIARRGVKVPTVYTSNFLERLNVGKMMLQNSIALSNNYTLAEVREIIRAERVEETQSAFPVVDEDEKPIGIVTLQDIKNSALSSETTINELIQHAFVTISEHSLLNEAVSMMAKSKADIIPVISDESGHKLVGIISHKSVVDAYSLQMNETEDIEQSINLRNRGLKILSKSLNYRKKIKS
ncbi:MAG: chloride channel protein [Bacteroidia bacterium]